MEAQAWGDPIQAGSHRSSWAFDLGLENRIRASNRVNLIHYLRLRGTNIPAGTPNETDPDGNPLFDSLAGNIPCPDCPDHTDGVVDYDVEAWADLWFYSNPIFIERGEKGGHDDGHDDDDDEDDDD